MGNSHDKPKPLRKALSVPNTHELPLDTPVLMKEKSRSTQRLNQPSGKSSKSGKSGKKSRHNAGREPDIQMPYTEAVFLPEFPLRGDVQNLDYDVIEVIAKGAYGNVIKVQREDEKRFYAVKVLDKAQILHDGAINQCKDEASIQSMAGNHPFVVKAYEYWQSHQSLYIVLDYIPHGDMFTLWTFHGCFPEELVRLYIAEMLMVLDYLHDSSVIYRDVKMENILFDPRGHIQLTDYGLAKRLQRGEQTRTVCGTLQYMAPEVLSVYPYGHAADWWSVGILMYAMLVGQYPVDGVDTHTKMAQRVFECDYLLPGNVSNSAQDVINRILTKSPHKRLCDLDKLQDLYFFQDLIFSDLMDGNINPVDVVPVDFFPMTGVSWAPQLLTREDQMQFDQFDDTNVAVARDNGHRYSDGYDDGYYQDSDGYDDSYQQHPQQRQHGHSDSYDSRQHHHQSQQPQQQQHLHSDSYSSYQQDRRHSDNSYKQQQHDHSENGYGGSLQRQHQQHDYYDYDKRQHQEYPADENSFTDSGQHKSNSARPQSLHQNHPHDSRAQANNIRPKDTNHNNPLLRERFDSVTSSHRDSVFDRYGSSGRRDPSPSQDYMAPSQNYASSMERQRSSSNAEPGSAAYMSMNGRGRSGSLGPPGDPREFIGRHPSSQNCEYVAPSLPKNPPPATLSSSGSSTAPPLASASGVRLIDPAPTVTLPASAVVVVQQKNSLNNHGVSVYADVKGRPKVRAQKSLSSSMATEQPSFNNNEYRRLEEAKIELITSPVIKSPPQPPPQHLKPLAVQQKSRLKPPPTPPKPAILKQPVKSVIAPIPAVRKSFNAKKKYIQNNNVAGDHEIPANSSSLTKAAATGISSDAKTPPGGNDSDKPRPVPKPRHNVVSQPISPSDEDFNLMRSKASINRYSTGPNQEMQGSSPDDDSFLWNLPTSSVPSYI